METLKSMTDTPLFTLRPSSLAATVASVTTGQPTISVAASQASKLNSTITEPAGRMSGPLAKACVNTAKTRRSASESGKTELSAKREIANTKGLKRTAKSKRFTRRSKKSSPSVPNGVIAYADVSETKGANEEADLITFVANKFRNKSSRPESICSTSDGQSVITGSSDVSNSSSARELKVSDVEDEDIDVDVDIENDDDENPVLQSRSASPSSVYQQLLKSAYIEQENTLKMAPKHLNYEVTIELAGDEISDHEDHAYNLDDSDSTDRICKSRKVGALSDIVAKMEGSLSDSSKDEHVNTERIGNVLCNVPIDVVL